MEVRIRVKFAGHQSVEVFGIRRMGERQAADGYIIGCLVGCIARGLNLVRGLRLPCDKGEVEI